MKFAIMAYAAAGEWKQLPPEEQIRRVRNHQTNLTELTTQRGIMERRSFVLTSTGLHSNAEAATTLRLSDGQPTMTDGPFAETKETLGGFDVIDFDSLDSACEWAKKGFAHPGHVVEIRPVDDLWIISNSIGARAESRGLGGVIERTPRRREDMERFILTILIDEARWSRLPQAEKQRTERQRQKVTMSYPAAALTTLAPIYLSTVSLRPSSETTTLRIEAGRIVSRPGPLAKTLEAAAMLVQLDCESRENAHEWARKLLLHDFEAIEVRPSGGFFVCHA
jgi:hypothetical protein